MTSVNYSITFDYNRFYAESELKEAAPDLASRLAGASSVEGALELAAPGAATTRIVDELVPWIQNLCFAAIPDLVHGKSASVHYFSRSGVLELSPAGDRIDVKGSLVEGASYPARELLQALYDCGVRFVKHMESAKRDDAAYIANLNYLKQFAESARIALQESADDR
ncbi:MAG: hypothetical protein ACO1PZ_08280 [Gammaproteobacteria bacterium]